MTAEFVDMENGIMVIFQGDKITGSYRDFVHAVVLETRETMTLEKSADAERMMRELREEAELTG